MIECCLYRLLGKKDARTVLADVHTLEQCLGLSRMNWRIRLKETYRKTRPPEPRRAFQPL